MKVTDIKDAAKNQAIEDLRRLIKDCGISHTTLEEVFMKVTGKKISKYVVKDIQGQEGISEGVKLKK